MRKPLMTFLLAMGAALCAPMAPAQVPQLIHYQGRLLFEGVPVNGTVELSLRMFNVPVGGATIYEDSNSVTVVDGLYSTFIGDHTVAGSLVLALTNTEVYVETAIDGIALSPRERLASAAYAMMVWGILIDTNPVANVVVHPAANAVTDGTRGAAILGGSGNSIGTNSNWSAVGGGFGNEVERDSRFALIDGGLVNRIGASSGGAAIGGGSNNTVAVGSPGATVAGGHDNSVDDGSAAAAIGGGAANRVGGQSPHATVAGGEFNVVGTNANWSTVAGGFRNAVAANSPAASIAGGVYNEIGANSDEASIGGGYNNRVSADSQFSAIGGGTQNVIESNVVAGAIAGGENNHVGANYGFAGGYNARAMHTGAFVWNGQPFGGPVFTSTAPRQFLVNAASIGFGTNVTPEFLTIAGNAAPSRSARFDLGSTGLYWRQVFIASNIIYRDAVRFGTTNGPLAELDALGQLSVSGGVAAAGMIEAKSGGVKFPDGTIQTTAGGGGGGTVTQVDTGAGLTGGPIINTGTIGIAPGGVTSDHLADGTVAAADVASGAIGSAAIADGSVALADMAANSVNSAVIVDGSVASADLAAGAVNSAAIADGGVAAVDLAADAVGSSAIADGTITLADLAANSVNSNSIVNGTVGLAELANNSVHSLNIINGTVSNVDLAIGAVDTDTILDGGITQVDMGPNSVDSPNIINGTIQNNDMGPNSIHSLNIINGTVSNIDLAANAVTGDKISDGTITSSDLAPGLLSGTFWNLAGNAGTTPGAHFVGTTDNQPLHIRVNNSRALRIEPGSGAPGAPNLIGGSEANVAGAGSFGVTIAGGGSTNFLSGSPLANSADGQYTSIGGGGGNRVGGYYSTIGGGRWNGMNTNAVAGVISGGDSNQVVDAADDATIAGGARNKVYGNSAGAAIGGGTDNVVSNSMFSTVGGGYLNRVASSNSVISGGFQNMVRPGAGNAAIGGGANNLVREVAIFSVVGGGSGNTIGQDSRSSVIGGGEANTLGTNADFAAIGGGLGNQIMGGASGAAIPGGNLNAVGAGATNAFAAGRRAKANHPGTFVWADDTDTDFTSTTNNQFLIRASGGVGIGVTDTGNNTLLDVNERIRVRGTGSTFAAGMWLYDKGLQADRAFVGLRTPGQVGFFSDDTSAWGLVMNLTNGFVGIGTTNPTNRLHVVGNVQCTQLLETSDRNAKENFRAVDTDEVLAKVAALPVTRWNFKTEAGVEHIGPMAQDFHAAFGLGQNDITISPSDKSGVALAAIQGLYQLVQEQRALLEEQRKRIENLEKQRSAL
jgi:hypothetical protein